MKISRWQIFVPLYVPVEGACSRMSVGLDCGILLNIILLGGARVYFVLLVGFLGVGVNE